jgi:hypothetical protein
LFKLKQSECFDVQSGCEGKIKIEPRWVFSTQAIDTKTLNPSSNRHNTKPHIPHSYTTKHASPPYLPYHSHPLMAALPATDTPPRNLPATHYLFDVFDFKNTSRPRPVLLAS